jgi:GDSL-like Lipase/Acylhydrolase family
VRTTSRHRTFLAVLAVAATVAAPFASIQATAAASSKPRAADPASGSPHDRQSAGAVKVPLKGSDVLAVATPADDGVRILVPRPSGAAGWRLLTTLSVRGWDAPAWTDYNCITGTGRYMAVAFAPASFVDNETLRDSGAPAAIVDLQTGSVRYLPVRVALKYHTPGCGLGNTVVFSRTVGSRHASTRLLRVAAATGRVIDTRRTSVDVTAAVPVGHQVVAALGRTLVRVPVSGRTRRLSTAPGSLYELRPGRSGSVDYMSVTGAHAAAAFERSKVGHVRRLARGPLDDLNVFQGWRGRNHLAGKVTQVAAGVHVLPATSEPVQVSLRGSVLVTSMKTPGVNAPELSTGRDMTRLVVERPGNSSLTTTVTDANPTRAGGASAAALTSSSRAGAGAQHSKGLTPAASTTPTGSVCAVAPLNPSIQIIQPSNVQLEWAANAAVRGALTTTRPANWEKHGLPAYIPQSGTFALPALTGSPSSHIPVQVLLGVMAQESNFSQASEHARAGVAGDPLIGNYYGEVFGADGLITGITPANADCGYGVGQITEHMTTADTTWTANQKLEVATDYEANLAAAAQLLAQDWNLLKANGIVANDANPNEIENWYMVLWVYNSGFHAQSGTAPWGLGWTNNPIQNDYPPNRTPFLSTTYNDAAHPGDWPYQEKVLGWAQHAQQDFVNGGFKYTASASLKLPTTLGIFCTTANLCSPTSTSTGFCLSTDRTTCWWHSPVSWLATAAGHGENAGTYVAGSTEPTVTDPYPASCTAAASQVAGTPGTTALPTGAVIVDELPTSSTNLAGCATKASVGSFSLSYGTDASGNTTAAVDTHQLGVGYMGHTYFAHTVDPTRGLAVTTGTWKPPATVTGWQRVWVHIPNNGADTPQADYTIHLTSTTSAHRVVDQRWNSNVWYDLGSFNLGAGASVSLSNATLNDWTHGPAVDISWDALAFTPSAKPAVDYVALGDSYQSGEGLGPFYANSDEPDADAPQDGCHRSPSAYGPLVFSNRVTAHPGNDEFHFEACSGAVMDDVTGGTSGTSEDFSEVPQLKQGYLDSNTTLVTIGIGGNDARFSDILKGCIATLTDCTAPGFKLTTGQGVDPEALTTFEPKVINGLEPQLRALYATIKSLAPNAQVIVVGYPHVVTTGAERTSDPLCNFSPNDLTFFQNSNDLLDSDESAEAAANAVTFLNPVATFTGHEACVPLSSNEWINGVVAASDFNSDGLKAPGDGSFHPKTVGQQKLAALIEPSLK